MPLVNAHIPSIDPNWALAGSPAGVYRANLPYRGLANTDLAALTTQVMSSVALPLAAGDIITSLTLKSGATAAGTPTNWWFALYDRAGALLAQTADQLTAAWAANTAKTLALTSAQQILVSGVYFAAVMVKATTVPTLLGLTTQAGAAGGLLAADKVLSQTSGSALTGTAPATIATPTAVGTVPLVIAS